MNQIGKILIFTGSTLIFIGVLIYLGAKLPGFGRLPGDIYVRKGTFTFYFPIVTSLLISVILSLLLSLFMRK